MDEPTNPTGEPQRAWLRWLFLFAPTALTALLVFAVYEPRVLTGGDNALYWALARSLVETGEYRNLGAPGAPLETSVPWGYPGLLALATTFLGVDYMRMKWVSVLFLVGAVAAFTGWVRGFGLRGWLGFGALLIVVLNSRILYFGNVVLTEAPYMLLSFAALWAVDRSEQSQRWWRILPGALLVSASYLVRPIGLALVLGLLLLLAYGRRWRDLALTALTAALIDGSWHLRSLLTPSEEENLYLHYLVKRGKYQTDDATAGLLDVVTRFLHNAAAYLLEELPELSTGWDSLDWLAGPILLLIGIGYDATRRKLALVHLYLPIYLAVLFLWLPESVSDRYLVVIQPLFVVLGCIGAQRIGERFGLRAAVAIPAAFFVIQAPGLITELVEDTLRLAPVRAEVAQGDPLAGRKAVDRAFYAMCVWARDAVPHGAVFSSRKDRMVWFWSEHYAVPLPTSDDPTEILQFFTERRVDYILVDSLKTTSALTHDRLAPATSVCPACFEPVFVAENGDYVARFRPEMVYFASP